MRPTHFSGGVTENAISPRFGVALNVPHLNWTFRAFYGHYYRRRRWSPLRARCSSLPTANDLGFVALCTASATKKHNSA